ncbi:MAG: cupin domain-containing protein [Rhodospirillales bacterium]|nr:cupin domain-containing protein [Rhodospirillales bacterium]
MSIFHHPGDEFLFDYATGALGEAWGLAIATHLALCPACRKAVADMEGVGGRLLEDATPDPIGDDVLSRVFEQIDSPHAPEVLQSTATPLSTEQPVLPEPLRGYAGGDVNALRWQRLGFGASQFLIPTGENRVSARLLRIPAGRPVPTHSHGGLELTLVVAGAFSDSTGYYGRGDLQEADSHLQHQPHATDEEDCICLAVTDAPLRFKSLAARIVQPFLGI